MSIYRGRWRPSLALLLTFVLLLLVSPAASAAKSQPSGQKIGMKYEGGSVELDQHDDVNVYVAPEKITVVQGKKTYEVLPKSVTEISYGNDVHRRVGAAIGVGLLTFGIGALMMFVKTKKHYVGLTWSNGDQKGGSVFKVGKGEYRGFLAALEGVTGLKAVNADAQTGTGGVLK